VTPAAPISGQATALEDARAAPLAVEPTRDVELVIEGMTCAACAVRIEKRLNKLDDVLASVNYATGTARVTAPAGMATEELIAAVVRAGYTATGPAAVADPDEEEPNGEDPPGGEADARHTAYLRRRLIVSLALFIPLTDLSMMLSLVPSLRFPGWQWLLVGCAAPVALWCAWPFHRAALKNARHGTTTMDTLVSLGIVAACGWSVYAMFALDRGGAAGTLWQRLVHNSGGGIYLETAATVTTFLLAGRLYEARARRVAGQAMRDLAAAAASEVCLLEPDGTERRVPATRLRPGMRFVVRPGETVAADGEVEFGQTAVDRSMMTGESVPGEAAEGDAVTGGTVVLTGRVVVRAVNVGRDTQLARLIGLVEQAQAQKAAIQRVADRICGVFVPAVLGCAAATFAGWLLAGGPAEHAFSAGLAVLIIACPCALGLATPAALVAASGRGARDGIFVKEYQALESSRAVDVVVLDKTGTVTTGRMELAGVCLAGGVSQSELLRYAGAVEEASEHSVAAAISAAARAECGPLPLAEAFRALPGLGARGVVDGREVVIGRDRLLADRGLTADAELDGQCRAWEHAGRTAVLVGWDGAVRGAIAVADTVKDSAAAAVAELRALGLRPILLTGDSEATARAVAAAAGIDEVIAGTLPAGKAAVIDGLRARGHRVAMVGDGINDGPALAAANLGLALGSGTDVAICAADVILLRDDLRCVPDAIRLSRATFATIRVNLGWAFGYNVAAIPLAALGLLNPILAAAAMTLSSVFVVANSLRLQRYPLRAASKERPGRRHARLHPRQGQLPSAPAPHRRADTRPPADGRGGQVLHRHPHPGVGRDQGASGGRARAARGAPQPLRQPGAGRGRRRRDREDQGSLGSNRPSRSFLTVATGAERHPMTTTTYKVTGMTCEHCVNAVITEVGALDGVSLVQVQLAPSGVSTVTVSSAAPVLDPEITAALDEAGGYQLA
jgi:cation-transporting P-type ATPase A/B/Cu+-exporting ATPase